MIKSCGGCTWFNKWTNDSIGGGLCDLKDARTKSDYGGNCKDWTGIKYKRKPKHEVKKEIERDLNNDAE